MKLSTNQAFNQFMAAATITSWSSNQIKFVCARVGKGLREAPVQRGYDTTAPSENRDSDFFYNWPGSQSIEDSLEILLEKEQYDLSKIQNQNSTSRETTTTILRNIDMNNETTSSSITTTTKNSTGHHNIVDKFDLGILQATPLDAQPTICMMGHDKDELLPADAYLRHEIESGRFAYSQILFDEASNTIFCNQENDIDDDIGCGNYRMRGLRVVSDAKLDATTVDCGGEAACMGATIGSKPNLVTTLDCHSGESACAYAKTFSVGSVFCTGPLSCYGAELLGVTHSVTCQGVPHPHQYYMPTCGGGEAGAIEAEDGHDIDVVCDGDFACIGNGQNDQDFPEFFPIDVGENGMLTCGGSLVGNKDGFTFVCKYIDLDEGCSSYECKEPSFAMADHAITGMFDSRDLKTCSKIFSLDQEEMCTGESYDKNDGEDDGEDDDDDDDDEEESSEEGGDDNTT
eukprot:CAMPEP_0116155250 /NCGR_PEP_ID=MMETSP0329-20121206/22207_1 /TAXON_ID=697910 /ORGANISM="Pseudo-nitzschia arenysensis, Strain B593" /LENGTH=457 /DNA_ID=CAMNT_0003652271 /DNA_START=97 /DNA_END=1467 /DNA_ORIENTATION=-